MSISINFETAAAGDKPIDIGPYPVLIKEFKLVPETKDAQDERLRSEDKYPYFNVRAEITEGPNAGHNLFCNLTTDPRPSDKNPSVAKNFMSYNFFKALGLANNESTDVTVDPNDIINKPMIWKVGIDKQDSNRNAVEGFAALPTS